MSSSGTLRGSSNSVFFRCSLFQLPSRLPLFGSLPQSLDLSRLELGDDLLVDVNSSVDVAEGVASDILLLGDLEHCRLLMCKFVQIFRCDLGAANGKIDGWSDFFEFDTRRSQPRFFQQDFVGSHHDCEIIDNCKADDVLDSLKSDWVDLKSIEY